MRLRLLTVCLFATTAHAQTPAGGQPHQHDGFQLALGVGGAFHRVTGTLDPEPPGDTEATLSGLGIAGMVLAGWAVSPGFTVGGGAMGGHIFKPTVEVAGAETDSKNDLIFLVVGPYLDWAPNPAGGLHVLAHLGVATLEDGSDDTDTIALGFGAGLGVGYDVWVSDQWAIGGLARLQMLRTSTEVTPALDVQYTSLVPALQVVATWQ